MPKEKEKQKVNQNLQRIRDRIAGKGNSRQHILYVPSNESKRVRLLREVDNIPDFLWHGNFNNEPNAPCQRHFGKKCKWCKDDKKKSAFQYALPVYSYDDSALKIWMLRCNSFSVFNDLVENYSEYGSLTNRDIKIGRTGEGLKTQYSIVVKPESDFKLMNKFKKFFSSKFEDEVLEEIKKIVNNSFPPPSDKSDYDEEDDEEVEDEEEEEAGKVEDEDDEDEDEEEDSNDDDDEEEDEPVKKKKPAPKGKRK